MSRRDCGEIRLYSDLLYPGWSQCNLNLLHRSSSSKCTTCACYPSCFECTTRASSSGWPRFAIFPFVRSPGCLYNLSRILLFPSCPSSALCCSSRLFRDRQRRSLKMSLSCTYQRRPLFPSPPISSSSPAASSAISRRQLHMPFLRAWPIILLDPPPLLQRVHVLLRLAHLAPLRRLHYPGRRIQYERLSRATEYIICCSDIGLPSDRPAMRLST